MLTTLVHSAASIQDTGEVTFIKLETSIITSLKSLTFFICALGDKTTLLRLS